MRYICKNWSAKYSEKYWHFADKFWKQFRQNLKKTIGIFRHISGEILTFHRQILKTIQTHFEEGYWHFADTFLEKNQTNFQKKMKFLRHILIRSQKHFQENIVPSKICLNLSDFFQICLEPSSRKRRKKHLGIIEGTIWDRKISFLF